jgi:hypothetical protein
MFDGAVKQIKQGIRGILLIIFCSLRPSKYSKRRKHFKIDTFLGAGPVVCDHIRLKKGLCKPKV